MAVTSPLTRRQTVAALVTLTAVTGLVDAVSYLRLGHWSPATVIAVAAVLVAVVAGAFTTTVTPRAQE
jgi:uncharacterized membrane protein YfcA